MTNHKWVPNKALTTITRANKQLVSFTETNMPYPPRISFRHAGINQPPQNTEGGYPGGSYQPVRVQREYAGLSGASWSSITDRGTLKDRLSASNSITVCSTQNIWPGLEKHQYCYITTCSTKVQKKDLWRTSLDLLIDMDKQAQGSWAELNIKSTGSRLF